MIGGPRSDLTGRTCICERVRGIVHMEAIAGADALGSDLPEQGRPFFHALPISGGRANGFGRTTSSLRKFCRRRSCGGLLDEEMDYYRQAFPSTPAKTAGRCCRGPCPPPARRRAGRGSSKSQTTTGRLGLLKSEVPKLFINGDPGQVVQGR